MDEGSKVRRIFRTGLIFQNAEKTQQGFVLFTPFGSRTSYLINTSGLVVHTWDLPCPPGLYALLDGDVLFLNGRTDEDLDLFDTWENFKGGAMFRIDWNSKILWSFKDRYHHHDGKPLKHGGAIYLSLEKIPTEQIKSIKGGTHSSSSSSSSSCMWGDVIREVNANGDLLWEWSAVKHLDPEKHVIDSSLPRDEWTHANTVVLTQDEKVITSFRNTSSVIIIDKKTKSVVWHLSSDMLSGQHDPYILDNGNMLVFDNGVFKAQQGGLTYSRVLEVSMGERQEIVWKYEAKPKWDLFSCTVSGSLRLPNGNTLITEGATGRMFQVTKCGEVVWEYINPFFFNHPSKWLSNMVFKAVWVPTNPMKQQK